MPRQPQPDPIPAGDDSQPHGAAIADWLRWAFGQLRCTSESPRLDAELLLCHVLEVPRTHLHAWPERAVPDAKAELFVELVDKRRAHQPVALLLGRQGFYGLDLEVTPDTLVPRPETELLVDFALEAVRGVAAPRVLDLGTGSGAIALAVAAQRPDAVVEAVEIDAAAAAMAADNARRLGLGNVTVLSGSWFDPVDERAYDVILANPPYVAEAESVLTSPETRYEPREALYAAEDGKAALKTIAARAPAHLVAGGWLALEHGFRQGSAVRAMLAAAGFAAIATRRDLHGHERMSFGQHPAPEGHEAP